MIRNFRHKGLKRLFEDGDRRGIRPDLLEKVENILFVLNRAKRPEDMNLPGFRLHPLKGGRKGSWAVTVRANWRIVFRLEDGAADVDLADYHREGRLMLMKAPPHPGRVVRQECLEPLGLTVTAAAKALGVTRKTLSEPLNGKSGLSPEMAIRLSKAFGSSPEVWLGLQMDYDLAQVQRKSGKIKVQRLAQVA